MPLIKSGSKKALMKNIKTEMEAHPGKENRAQNLAIAYSVQRKNKKKHMAEGGKVEHDADKPWSHEDKKDFAQGASEMSPLAQKIKNAVMGTPSPAPQMKAHGGEMHEEDMHEEHGGEVCSHCAGTGKMSHMSHHERMEHEPDHEMPHDKSMVERIMQKRKHMAEGGQVDLEEHAVEGPGERDKQNLEASKKEMYDDSQLEAQPMDSNEHGDDLEDEDEHGQDHISKIMRKMKMR
jgi:hypothetical protein